MPRRVIAPLIAGLAVSAFACTTTDLPFGDVNSIIVGSDPALWDEVGDTVSMALQPTITTTSVAEEVFQVTHRNPADSLWGDFRRFRQLLLVGRREDPWVAAALSRTEDPGETPAIAQATDVWARSQTVTIVIVPDQNPGEALVSLLPELRERYLQWYRDWARAQMFVTGRDTALADTLRTSAGFELMVPQVYTWERRDSVFIFRNDNPDPSELIRQFTVTWMTPAPDSLTTAELIAWREDLAREHYDPAHLSDTSLVSHAALTIDGYEARRLQAIWKNPPEADWPAAGSFILQTVRCPQQDRLYLTDAWLYAPGRDKFEYMYQLETILDSFRCGGA